MIADIDTLSKEPDTVWRDVTTPDPYDPNGWRYIRTLSDIAWISCLHRLTGFGFMETETAFCYKDPNEENQITQIILGDHREALTTLTLDEVIEYFKLPEHEKNTLATVLDKLKQLTDES